MPYCRDNHGYGPAWEHSLFEDNAEFAYGFFHAQDVIRKELLLLLTKMKDDGIAVQEIDDYLKNWNESGKSRQVSDALLAKLEGSEKTEDVINILENREYLAKNPSGQSAETAGHMISALAGLIMSWRRTEM